MRHARQMNSSEFHCDFVVPMMNHLEKRFFSPKSIQHLLHTRKLELKSHCAFLSHYMHINLEIKMCYSLKAPPDIQAQLEVPMASS